MRSNQIPKWKLDAPPEDRWIGEDEQHDRDDAGDRSLCSVPAAEVIGGVQRGKETKDESHPLRCNYEVQQRSDQD